MKTKVQFSHWFLTLMLLMSISITLAQPYPNQGAQTVCLNSNEPYGVIANTGSTYTWSITPASGGTITGSTNTISIHWTVAGTFTLQVVEKNALGCDGVPVTIQITVLPLLQAGTVAANQTICYNAIPTALTSVDPTGGTGSYTYQWDSSPEGTTWTPIAGATTSGYAPAALTATTYYRLHQTSGSCGTVTTNTVIITVQPNLVVGSAAANQTICYNTVPAALTSVNATGGTGSYTYQWDSSPDGLAWTAISGATTAGYAPAALTATTYYRLHQTSGSCGTVTTNTVIITVQPNLVVGSAAANQTICYNTVPAALTSVNATGGTGSYTYQWDSSPDGTTWTTIAGATTSGYAPAALTATTYYRLHQTSGACGTVTTNTVMLTVNSLPVPTVAGDSPVCATTSGVIYTTEAGMSNYLWSVSAGGTITAGGTTTSNTVTVTWNTAGPQSVSVNYTNANTCTAATPANYSVTVDPLPATSPIYHN